MLHTCTTLSCPYYFSEMWNIKPFFKFAQLLLVTAIWACTCTSLYNLFPYCIVMVSSMPNGGRFVCPTLIFSVCDSDQYFNYHRFEYIHYLRWSEARKICINSTVYPSYPLLLCIRSLLLLVIAEKGVEERSYMPQEREWWIIFFSLR